MFFVSWQSGDERDGPLAHRSRRRHARAADESQQRRGLSDAHRCEHGAVRRGDDSGAGPWLWALDVEQRRSRRISLGLEQYTSVSASADGSRLVATVANPSSTLWTVPILDRVADERDVQPFPRVQRERRRCHSLPRASLFYVSVGGIRQSACGALATASQSSSGAPETIRCRRLLALDAMPGASPSRCDATASCVCTCCRPTAPSRSR